MYFLRRLRPLEVSGERVRALRVSLNAPVLTTPDLPIGPARAVIVVHRETSGRMDTTVGARSQRSGDIAYWSFDGDLTSDDDLSVAADAALTFAESLGFLFDEHPLRGDDADKAWMEWVAGALPAVAGSAAGEMPELDLGDLLADEVETAVKPVAAEKPIAVAKPAAPPKPAATPAAMRSAPAAAPPALPPSRTLSKFRGREAAGTAPAPPAAVPRKAPIRQPLARLQLVKRRSPEEERRLMLRKLLTSF